MKGSFKIRLDASVTLGSSTSDRPQVVTATNINSFDLADLNIYTQSRMYSYADVSASISIILQEFIKVG